MPCTCESTLRRAPKVVRLAPVASLRRIALAAALSVLAIGSAQAGLFDDEEARKAIVDLRNRTTQVEEQGKARAGEMAAANAQMTEQLAALRRSLLDLNNQLEAMRGELARLRGTDEQI